jgi:threonine dehydrogenase-like Zn-dependent dehydrogenase
MYSPPRKSAGSLRREANGNTKTKDWEELLEMVEHGTVDPTIMLTHRFSLDDIDKAYHLQEKRESGLVKCFVETRFSSRRTEGTPELTRL